MDLVLSSGYLAFAAQTGFLKAIEELGIAPSGLCGTSSGALAGLLWAAGLPADEVFGELTRQAPLLRVRPSARPWRGVLSLGPMASLLRERLPARLEDFDLPVAVGTRGPDGRHVLLTRGPAAEAVCASCAVPWLFAPIAIDGALHADGGVVDRTALGPWRAFRGSRATALHLVERSAGRELHDDLEGVTVVRSPRSGAQLWGLGDARARFERTRQRTLEALRRS